MRTQGNRHRRCRQIRATIAVAGVLLVVPGIYAGGNREEPPSAPSTPADTFAPGPPPEVENQKFFGQDPPGGAGIEFLTDFSRATIPFHEIRAGGPPKDGIPPIDEPRFMSLADARGWLAPHEPVLLVDRGQEAHIYPLQVLMWHEIVNDEVDGVPITVTYCPLCNTGVAFDRRFEGEVLDFGTTGRLRYSNLLMYDRQTESWWQQASGDAVIGFYTGQRLSFVPVLMLSFEEAAAGWPQGRVLTTQTGYNRAYGRNPYGGYDSAPRPFLYAGPDVPDDYRLLERVISLEHRGDQAAVAFPVLQEETLVETTVGGQVFYAIWEAGTASALDADTVAGGQDVGSANMFFPWTRDGEPVELSASAEGDRIVVRDTATGSRWNAAGRAVFGPRRGAQLEPAPGVQHFWFSHSAFDRTRPE